MQTGHTLAVRRSVAADRTGLATLLSDMQAHYGSPDLPGGSAEADEAQLQPEDERLHARRRSRCLIRSSFGKRSIHRGGQYPR